MGMTMLFRPIVRVTRRINASAEHVFDAWLDQETVGKWLFATPTGEMVRVELDPKVGGAFTIVERRDGVDMLHTGEYLEITPSKKLVFTFGVPQLSKEFTKVTVEIRALEDEQCELTLNHENVLPDYANQTKKDWGMILDNLAKVLLPT